MTQWVVNETNPITVVTEETVDLIAFIAPSDTGVFTQVVTPFTQSGSIHRLAHTFDTVGSYLVRVVDQNNTIPTLYTTIHVEDRNAWKANSQTDLDALVLSVSNLSDQLNAVAAQIVDVDTDVQTVLTNVATVTSNLTNHGASIDAQLVPISTGISDSASREVALAEAVADLQNSVATLNSAFAALDIPDATVVDPAAIADAVWRYTR